LVERLRGYFRHAEAKSVPADGLGLLGRRHVYCCEQAFLGKESNAVRDLTAEESGGYLGADAVAPYVAEGLAIAIRSVGVGKLARQTGTPRQTLYDIVNGARAGEKTRRGLRRAIRNSVFDEG
jgi:hypothetical protein